jgi:LPS export ABC transporter protein LptC
VTSTRTLFIVLAVGAASAAWLKSWLEEDPPDEAAEISVLPGFYMVDADVVALGEDGQPVYYLKAERLEQAAENQPATLEQVRLEYDPRTGIDWILTAPRGRVSADLAEVRLDGGVEILSAGDRPTTRMVSEDLTVLVEANQAVTDGPVEITQDGARVEAVGLVADLMAETVRLESRVHGQYLP